MNIDYKKLTGLVLVALYFIYCISNPTLGHFIDAVDLVIHEAGHIIFIFFGEFLHVLGGSLTQILIPAIFSGYFFLRRDLYSGSLLLFWVGYNIVNVSIYMGDAIVMQLPLLGGDSVIHDWNWLMTDMGILKYTSICSTITYSLGIFVIVTGGILCLMATLSRKDQKKAIS